MWICIIVFAATALIALLDLAGVMKIEDKGKSKALFTTLIIAIAGVGATAFKENLNKEDSKNIGQATISEEISKQQEDIQPDSPSSIEISNQDLLAIKGKEGIAVASITAIKNCKAQYSWRFLPDKGVEEITGAGELYEKYAVEKETGNTRHLIDLNGKLKFSVGPYNLTWSCSSENSSWLSGDGILKLAKLSNESIESFQF